MRLVISRYHSQLLPLRRQLPRVVRFNHVHQRSIYTINGDAIEELLSKPTWSVEALHNKNIVAGGTPQVTQQLVHHLLNLSALPLPETEKEEHDITKMLESQLHFVQAVRDVDTTGVQPLQNLRDETAEADEENEITVDTLQEHFTNESSRGFARRIVRRASTKTEENDQQCEPLGQAAQTLGRYVLVNTKDI